jgi:hypothetical protein
MPRFPDMTLIGDGLLWFPLRIASSGLKAAVPTRKSNWEPDALNTGKCINGKPHFSAIKRIPMPQHRASVCRFDGCRVIGGIANAAASRNCENF